MFLLLARDVAAHAPLGVFLGRAAESKDGVLLQGGGNLGVVAVSRFHRVRVRLARAMAGFAIHRLVRFFALDLGVGGFAELRHFGFVARPATLRAYVALRSGLWCQLPRQ